MSVPTGPVVKLGALAGALSLPSVARALTATGTGTAAAPAVQVNFSLTLNSQIRLIVAGRNGVTLGTGTSGTFSEGHVSVNQGGVSGGVEYFAVGDPATAAYFVLPLQIGVGWVGPTSVQVFVHGNLTGTQAPTSPGVTTARFACGGTPNWTGVPTLPGHLNDMLGPSDSTCATFTRSPLNYPLDLAMYLPELAEGKWTLSTTITAISGP